MNLSFYREEASQRIRIYHFKNMQEAELECTDRLFSYSFLLWLCNK
jgi:hypothetical protein